MYTNNNLCPIPCNISEFLSFLPLLLENEDNEIMLTTEKIKNITTGMDIFQLDLDKLKLAPNEWNFYVPLNDNKMSELIESIIDNGLLNPIIV